MQNLHLIIWTSIVVISELTTISVKFWILQGVHKTTFQKRRNPPIHYTYDLTEDGVLKKKKKRTQRLRLLHTNYPYFETIPMDWWWISEGELFWKPRWKLVCPKVQKKKNSPQNNPQKTNSFSVCVLDGIINTQTQSLDGNGLNEDLPYWLFDRWGCNQAACRQDLYPNQHNTLLKWLSQGLFRWLIV